MKDVKGYMQINMQKLTTVSFSPSHLRESFLSRATAIASDKIQQEYFANTGKYLLPLMISKLMNKQYAKDKSGN